MSKSKENLNTYLGLVDFIPSIVQSVLHGRSHGPTPLFLDLFTQSEDPFVSSGPRIVLVHQLLQHLRCRD